MSIEAGGSIDGDVMVKRIGARVSPTAGGSIGSSAAPGLHLSAQRNSGVLTASERSSSQRRGNLQAERSLPLRRVHLVTLDGGLRVGKIRADTAHGLYCPDSSGRSCRGEGMRAGGLYSRSDCGWQPSANRQIRLWSYISISRVPSSKRYRGSLIERVTSAAPCTCSPIGRFWAQMANRGAH